MFCKNCGSTLNDSATFCKECGKGIEHVKETVASADMRNSDAQILEDEDNEKHQVADDRHSEMIIGHKIFHSNDEILIDSLGSGFLSNIIADSSFNKAVLICSNKRVYQKGKLIFRDYQRKLIYAKGEAVVDLKDITGMFYEIVNPVFRLWDVAVIALLNLILFFVAESQEYYAESIYSAMGIITLIGLIFLIAYYAKKSKYFVIQHAGGEILANSNWYKESSIRRFMKNVSIQKDKISNYKTK